jgi:MoaA/NifB/PqqE/SkfB family radical SAM enzyme
MATDTIQTHLLQSNRGPSWRRRKLNTLIFFVTSHCNATCDTCFYWDELNRPGDLDWKEIVKLSKSMPQLTDLWFSGGEPTLRRDIEDIINLFVARNGVRHINLPTNGLKPGRIYEIAERCLENNPRLELHINIALDGLRDSHDAMRGVPGNFDKAIESARILRKLKPRFGRRLEVHINTVITRDNLDEILPMSEWIFSEKLVDGHYFNLIRGNAKDPGLKVLGKESLRRIYPEIADLQTRYAHRLINDRNPLIRWFKRMAYVGTLTFHHRTQLANLEGSRKWSMPCTAGETSAVVDFDGRVRACEMREPVADLRKIDMQFKVFWESSERKAETKQISCDQCWCTHVCFIHDSLRYSYKTMLLEVPRNYFSRKVW